jgi:hypothetical protein
MKSKTTLLSVLSIVLLTSATSAQTLSGDQIAAATAGTRAKFDASRFAPVRVVSAFDASGKPILIVSGESLLLTKTSAKALATTAILVTADARTVQPGQTALIGTTSIGTTGGSTIGRTDTLVVSAPRAAGAATLSANPLAASIERQVFVGDLPRDTSTASRGLTVGTSAGAAAETAIGPNGFPIFIGTAAPQSGALPIGPNGFPLLTTTGPQSGIQPINPNGFPATNVAPVAQTGLTREGASRDTTVPSTTAPVTAGPARASTIVAPNQATAVMTTPATAVGTAAPASPQLPASPQ